MRTKGDCLNLYLRLLDEATKKGVAIPTTKNADYRDKFNYFLNEAQIYIASLIKIPAVYQITQNEIPNLLSSGFEMKQYLPGTDLTLTSAGAKSYYFEMDNVGSATITVNGVTIATITNTIKKVFTAYYANTGATATDIVTITFAGLYPYNVRNTAMYAYAFPTNADVPAYTPQVIYDMPSDFMSFDDIINKNDDVVYRSFVEYRWEKSKKIIFSYEEKGSFDIHYFAYPAPILSTDADTVLMSVEDKAIDLVVLQAGIMATAADNPSLSSWLRSLYIEKVQNITNETKINDTTIQTVYSIGG